MFDINAILKGRDSAADFARARGEAELALRQHSGDHQALLDRRRVVLVDGTLNDLDAIDAEIAKSARELERIEASRAALSEREAAARKAEAEAALQKIHNDAEAARVRGVKLLLDYEKRAEALAALLAELAAVDRIIAEANNSLRLAAPNLVVDAPEAELARQAGAQRYASVHGRVKLPPIVDTEHGAPIWPRRVL